MEIGSDEIVAILKRHYVAEDTGILQDRYRRQLGQRLMASLRDDDGRREVMSNGKGRYFVLECCRDQRQLQSVQRRIQNQMRPVSAKTETSGKNRNMSWKHMTNTLRKYASRFSVQTASIRQPYSPEKNLQYFLT